MNDLERLLERLDEVLESDLEPSITELIGPASAALYARTRDAARAYRDLLANGAELDYEAALLYGKDKAIEVVPLWTQEMADVDWEAIVRAAVDAAIGDRLLVDPPKEEGE